MKYRRTLITFINGDMAICRSCYFSKESSIGGFSGRSLVLNEVRLIPDRLAITGLDLSFDYDQDTKELGEITVPESSVLWKCDVKDS